MKRKICVVVAMILVLSSVAIMAFASGGPKTGNGSATVTNTTGTGGSYSFGYTFDSTYYGALSSERPNVATGGANASVTFASNTFTISATSSAGENLWGSWSDKSAQNVSTEATITNNSQSTLIIGYTFSASGGTVAGSDYAVGSGTITLIPGQSIFLTVKTQVTSWTAGSSTATATFKITSCKEVLNYDLKIYPSQFGSYNYSVGSTVTGTLNSGSSVYTTQASASDKITLSVPEIYDAYAEEYYFYGWSVNGSVTTSTVAYSASVTTHTTVFPVFIKKGTVDESGNGPFYVNGKYYVFWREAFIAAGTSYPVVLTKNYTLPTTLQENGVVESDGLRIGGNAESVEYIVPANATLQIPYNADNTLCTTDPTYRSEESHVTPTIYRTLTLSAGVKIEVNGAISLSGQMGSYQPKCNNGAPYGDISHIATESGSSIVVNSGGNLYCWGIISGSGSVTLESGANLYQNFQVTDFRGGKASSSMEGNEYGVFPMNQYYFQNVEVPLTIKAGAKMIARTAMNMSIGMQTPSVTLFGGSTEGLFRITSGNVVLDYQEATDRMNVTVNGTVSINSVTLSFRYILTIDLDTAEYVMPLNPNMSIYVKDGSEVNITEDLALLPSCEVVIEQGGEVYLKNNAKLYVYDTEQWGPYVMSAAKMRPVLWSYANGTTAKRTESGLTDASVCVNGVVDATEGYIYTTSSGANIYSTGNGVVILQAGNDTETYQATYANETVSYSAIPITPAKLKNGDNLGYVGTENGTYKYDAGHKRWALGEHSNVIYPAVAATCTENGKTEGVHCTCEYVIREQNIVAALGHTEVIDAAVAPTCTTTGLTDGTHCSVCGEVLVAQESVAATGIHLWEIRTVNGNDHMHSCKYDGCNSFVTLHVEYRLNDYLWFNGYFTDECLVHGGSIEDAGIKTAVSNNKLYILKAVPADEIPEEISFTISCATGKGTFTVSLENYDASDDDSLKQALLAYGDAAKDHFGGTSVENAPTKPDLKNDRDKQVDELQTMGNLSISTSGATIYFDEAIRLSVKYALNAGENVVIDEVNKTITIDGITYNVVQVGVLLKEMGFADDGQTWSWNGETLTTVNGMACLTFNVPEITAPEGYLPNQPNVPADPDNPDLKLPGDTMVNEFAVSGEATFNLTAGQYLKGFSLRAFAVLEERDDAGNGTGVYHCIYGKQYGYGLEAYIKRMYGSEDGAFDNLLYWTWNLAQVANGRDPLNATGG